MLRSGTIIMIREKAQAGKSSYAIGKELGISKNTAKKYLQLQEEAPAKIDRPSKLDAYKPLLHQLMDSGIFNCVVLLERLQAEGYDGGISIIKDYVHPYRPAKHIPAVRRFETLLGKQAQMDWGICQYEDSGGSIPSQYFFTLCLDISSRRAIERCDSPDKYACRISEYRSIPTTIPFSPCKTSLRHLTRFLVSGKLFRAQTGQLLL